MSAKISVILPVYNTEPYLAACLDSVLGQSFTEFELICIDDCSTDGSLAILQAYAQRDPRIVLLRNETNLRAADTRNAGLDRATGTYVYFMDADDYLDPDYLREMYDKADETKADIVTNTNILTETNGVSRAYVHPSSPELPPEGCFLSGGEVAEKVFCVVWMRLFRRSFLEENRIRFQRVNMVEDIVFHYTTSLHAASIYLFHGAAAYHYLIRGDSVTGVVSQNNQRDLVTMRAYELIFDHLESHGMLEATPIKLYSVSPFFKVDTAEKFSLYRRYFRKIETYLQAHRERYNAMDLFFAESILNAESHEDYLSRYSPNVAMAFLKRSR